MIDTTDSMRSSINPGKKFEVIEVIGKWDDGTAQKAVADAIAIHKKFDGIYTQGGSTGTVQALIDTHHPFIPVSGETENGFRKLCAKYADQGPLRIIGRNRSGPGRR